jgi:hypothetical protein
MDSRREDGPRCWHAKVDQSRNHNTTIMLCA